MNYKGITVISIIIVLIVSVTFLSTTQQFEESMRPTIESNLDIQDDTSISLIYSDNPQVIGSNKVKNSDVTFMIDEYGKKQYIIEVEDIPAIQE